MMLPMALVVTPNHPEAEVLVGVRDLLALRGRLVEQQSAQESLVNALQERAFADHVVFDADVIPQPPVLAFQLLQTLHILNG